MFFGSDGSPYVSLFVEHTERVKAAAAAAGEGGSGKGDVLVDEDSRLAAVRAIRGMVSCRKNV